VVPLSRIVLKQALKVDHARSEVATKTRVIMLEKEARKDRPKPSVSSGGGQLYGFWDSEGDIWVRAMGR